MRTTVTLSEEIYREAKAQAARSARSVSQFIEDALREALRPRPLPHDPPERDLPVFGGSGVLPGVDLADGAALLEEMDRESSVDALR